MDKNELRGEFREMRDGAVGREALGRLALARLCGLDVFLAAGAVFCYVGFGSEVDTVGVIGYALSCGKKVAVPRIVGKYKMEFVWVDGLGTLRPNKMGILEPTDGEVAVPGEGAVFIVPGLVFSETMHRVGYGGGFYDAYLSGKGVIKIGLCYEFQVVKSLPFEEYDVRMDYIVTDERVVL